MVPVSVDDASRQPYGAHSSADGFFASVYILWEPSRRTSETRLPPAACPFKRYRCLDDQEGSVASSGSPGTLPLMATPRSTRDSLFLGRWFQDAVIIVAVRWYLRYPLSYRQVC